MSSHYEKVNGKWRLVKDKEKQEPLVVVNERLGPLTLEELNVRNQELEARVKRLEGMLIGAGVKK